MNELDLKFNNIDTVESLLKIHVNLCNRTLNINYHFCHNLLLVHLILHIYFNTLF